MLVFVPGCLLSAHKFPRGDVEYESGSPPAAKGGPKEAVEKEREGRTLQSTEHLPYMRRILGPAPSQTLEGARGGQEDLPGPACGLHPDSGTVIPGFGTGQLCCLRQCFT